MQKDTTNDNISYNINSIIECSICLNNINNDINTLKCNHSFHNNCIILWQTTNNTCPLCRAIIPPPINTNKKIFIPEIDISLQVLQVLPSLQVAPNYNNIKKFLVSFMFYISFIIYASFALYNVIIISLANTHINNFIMNKNNTEIDNKPHSTYDSGLLFAFDILYLLIFFTINLYILKTKQINPMQPIIMVVLLITMLMLHNAFISNTKGYLNNKIIDINPKNFNYYLDFSFAMLCSSLALKIPSVVLLIFYNLN